VPQWPERKIAGHASVSVTLKIYAEEFDKAMHRDDLIARINKAAFSSVERACRHRAEAVDTDPRKVSTSRQHS
jgi:hypothetical protein